MKLPRWVWIFAAIVCWPSMLIGCAHPVKGTCAFLHIGENESGVSFFKYECQPER